MTQGLDLFQSPRSGKFVSNGFMSSGDDDTQVHAVSIP